MKQPRWRAVWLCTCVMAVCTGCSASPFSRGADAAPPANTNTSVHGTHTAPRSGANAANGTGAGHQADPGNQSAHLTNTTLDNATPPPPSRPVPATGPVTVTLALPPSAHLEIPVQNQLPQQPNGCEVTSLSMLFTAIGDPVSRFTLATDVAKAPGELVKNPQGQIVQWGDPNVGFVGSIGDHPGYAVYHGPIIRLIDQFLPGRAIDLTGQPFDAVLAEVASGAPVEVWTNQTFQPLPDSEFITWQSPDGPVRATFDEHAVVVVGYDANQVFINNPLGGIKDQALPMQPFIAAWQQMGSQAVTITPVPPGEQDNSQNP